MENDAGYLTEHQPLSDYLPLSGGTMTGQIILTKGEKVQGGELIVDTTLRINQSIKRKYGAEERTYSLPDDNGTLALTNQIPTNVSQLSNDAGYLTQHQSLTSLTSDISCLSSDVQNIKNRFETRQDEIEFGLFNKYTSHKENVTIDDLILSSDGVITIFKGKSYQIDLSVSFKFDHVEVSFDGTHIPHSDRLRAYNDSQVGLDQKTKGTLIIYQGDNAYISYEYDDEYDFDLAFFKNFQIGTPHEMTVVQSIQSHTYSKEEIESTILEID